MNYPFLCLCSQKGNELVDGGYDTMPSALFFSILALGGEWALVDFTWLGQIVQIMMIVFGIGMFSVPAGIFFEGFEDILEARQQAKVYATDPFLLIFMCLM